MNTVDKIVSAIDRAVTGRPGPTPIQRLAAQIIKTFPDAGLTANEQTKAAELVAAYRHCVKVLETHSEANAHQAWFKQHSEHSTAFRSGQADAEDTVGHAEFLGRAAAKRDIAQRELNHLEKEAAACAKPYFTRFLSYAEKFLADVESQDRATAEKFGLPNIQSPMVLALKKLVGQAKNRTVWEQAAPAQMFELVTLD